MKKKVFSIVLTLAMLVSMFSFFTVPAGATPILFPIEGFIIVPNNEFYHEIILSDLTVGESYNFLLDIPHGNGWVIIQTFGPHDEYSFEAKLYQNTDSGWEVAREHNNGFKNLGYGRQTFIQFYPNAEYALNITPLTAEDIRLSVTIANEYFEREPPIMHYEHIAPIDLTNGLQVLWDCYTPAVVGLFTPTESRMHNVQTTGSEYMKSYIIDPTSTEAYSCYPIPGEVDQAYYLEAGVTYYLVMYIPVALEEHPTCILRLTIG